MTLVELCAGTAALSLRALAGHPIDPLTGFMGGKRRWAGEIAELLGVHRERPDRVVLVDAGPWGEVWDLLRDRDAREGVAGLLDAWDREVASDRPTLVTALWLRLAERPPAEDPVDRVAQYLWIQARSATGIPVWWSGSEWVGPTGAKWAPSTSSLVGGGAGRQAGRRPDGAVYGPDSPATIARRIRALDAIDWSRVEVRRCPVQDVEPMPGATVYFDPPYQGAPRYAVLFPREEVLDVSRRWAAAGCRVAVSEGEPLPLEGWTSSALPRSVREHVTTSWGGRLAEQGSLPLGVGPERGL